MKYHFELTEIFHASVAWLFNRPCAHVSMIAESDEVYSETLLEPRRTKH